MNKFLLFLPLLLLSCERPTSYKTEIEIAPEDKDKVAKFIAELCEKSNPKSDEEPEDMIKEAKETALELYGKKVKYKCGPNDDGWVRIEEQEKVEKP